MGANSAALEMLGMAHADIGALTIEHVLLTDVPSLLQGDRHAPATPRRVQRPDGSEYTSERSVRIARSTGKEI